MISVALGYTSHLVAMIAQFLDVPLRYPVTCLGSGSQISDYIIDKLTDKERNFPLYSKGRERLQYNYAVYLLNKDIAQFKADMLVHHSLKAVYMLVHHSLGFDSLTAATNLQQLAEMWSAQPKCLVSPWLACPVTDVILQL
ncbi:hypothetical protein NP493_509g00000 [Ridgeia piscesae]|uniref:Uncharacterized protein n=1 Tax=Ridgeia piscesae TaxID=27915 RepID=A0AAD9KYB7_RIDPI|nr:hypothetical protein NP493_509g00000 [Ridgeia piscesae]